MVSIYPFFSISNEEYSFAFSKRRILEDRQKVYDRITIYNIKYLVPLKILCIVPIYSGPRFLIVLKLYSSISFYYKLIIIEDILNIIIILPSSSCSSCSS